VLRIDGADDLTVRGLTFAHTLDSIGIYDRHKGWAGSMRALDPSFPEEFPAGVTVAQSAPDTGDGIVITNAKGVVFENCVVRNTGGWGKALPGISR
jgi:hypothetical protein